MKTHPAIPAAAAAFTLLAASLSHATIIPYASYPLGEEGTLGSANKPQDDSGNNRHFDEDINGGATLTGNASFHSAATGSTAYLDTSSPDNEGWYSSANTYHSLPTDNFAFGIFARAAANTAETRADVFTLGNSNGSFKLSLEGGGWTASSHNVNWIGSSATFEADTWVHLAIIRINGQSTFYVDGVPQGSSFGGAPVHSHPHLSVSPGGGAYFDGHLDEARVVVFTSGETVENILAALQQGVVPTSFVNAGSNTTFKTANLSTDEASVFRLGGVVEDFVIVSQADGLSVVEGTAPKHLIHISQEGELFTGAYPLIGYSGTIGGLGFDGLELAPLPGRVAGMLVNNTDDATIDLVITGSASGNITWTGAVNGTWDIGTTQNWVFTGGSAPTAFFAGDTIWMDDSAAVTAINLAETATPTGLTIQNTAKDYTFSGAGIGGSAYFDKFGTGTVTFTNPNTHSGPIYIDAGTLRLGDGGSLGTGALTNYGALVIDRSGTVSMPNVISGDGTLEMTGSGTLILSGASSFTGPVTVTAGTLASGNASSLGSSEEGTVIAAGASLDVFTGGVGDEPVTIHGEGVDGLGAVVSSAVAGQLDGVKKLALGSDSTIGGPHRWDVRGDGAEVGGNFKLTKIGGNQVSLVGASVTVRDIEVVAGMLSIENGADVGDSNPGMITVHAGAVLGFGDWFAPVSCTKPIALEGGGIDTTSTGEFGNATVASPVSLGAGVSIVNVRDGAVLTLTGALSGSGSLEKTGSGTLVVTSAPAHGGDTAVAAGTLSLGAAGLDDSSTVSLGSSAVLVLDFGGSDTVEALFIGGIQQPAGLYDASHASGRFAGGGSLTVTTGAELSGYDLWAAVNGIAGAGPEEDSDGDGIPNGIEFVIGGDPGGPGSNSSSLLPTVARDGEHFVFIFRRADASAAFDPFVEYSSTLDGWAQAQHGVDGVEIGTEDDFFGEGIDRVTVRMPVTLAPGSKLFARLGVSIP